MAHRRKHRRHARENPLSDTTTIVIAVGVTAAVVGVGYFLYKRSKEAPVAQIPMFSPGGSAQQGQGGVQNTPPTGAPQGGSQQTPQQSSSTSTASLAPNLPPQYDPPPPGYYVSQVGGPGCTGPFAKYGGFLCPVQTKPLEVAQYSQFAEQSALMIGQNQNLPNF